MIISNKIVNK